MALATLSKLPSGQSRQISKAWLEFFYLVTEELIRRLAEIILRGKNAGLLSG
jgi:hypothetical protein